MESTTRNRLHLKMTPLKHMLRLLFFCNSLDSLFLDSQSSRHLFIHKYFFSSLFENRVLGSLFIVKKSSVLMLFFLLHASASAFVYMKCEFQLAVHELWMNFFFRSLYTVHVHEAWGTSSVFSIDILKRISSELQSRHVFLLNVLFLLAVLYIEFTYRSIRYSVFGVHWHW